MKLTFDVNVNLSLNPSALAGIFERLNAIMTTQAELAEQLRAVTVQNEKAHQEIVAKIAALEEALANAGNATPEVEAAMADLKASVQRDDDLHADAPPVEA